jgi:hypothetical protein
MITPEEHSESCRDLLHAIDERIPPSILAYVMGAVAVKDIKLDSRPYLRTYSCRTCQVTWKELETEPEMKKPHKCWSCGKFGQHGNRGVA